ncbi:MmoB/DmpM family protein [Zavarzinia compransoris]|uniref:Monooxygenase n=1 Tax=Zavarzinia compransoris TaxID=1264899 RepID=A0A317DTE6_9PROT|nr:MmoB/DmpM family protein [Zavarzinia compransoris]PWR17949.1 monooxygenase [Zavarzinia compransoris]TDP40078.1 phenol hydroxylase P2 protein [Zavarzinia compransoris]
MAKVSITLQNTDEARSLVEAIVADNPAAEVSRMPALTKIDCEGSLSVRRETVEARLGRRYDLQELQLSLISLAGNVEEDDDSFTLAWAPAAPTAKS